MTDQEQTTWRYLLGEMSEAELEAIEQEYFSDRRLFDRMVEAENELVDKYARGLLPPAARDRFEKYYLAHPGRRERAKFAEALTAKVGQTSAVGTAAPARAESWWSGWLSSVRDPKLAWALSLAVLLLAAGAAWSLIETRRLRQELARAEADGATRQQQRERELQQQVADERLRAERLSDELERLRAEQQDVLPLPTPAPAAAPSFATLVLTVGGTRDIGTGPPAVLVIPAGTERVRLRLNLRESDYTSYRAALQPAGGAEVYAWQRLTPRAIKSGAGLDLVLPARRLAAGDYVLTLRGVGESGEVEDVSKSLFRVERR